MNGIKKSILTAALTLTVGILLAGSALAVNYYPNEIVNLQSYLNDNKVSYTAHLGAVGTGNFYVTSLGYEAADTNTFQTSATNVLFTNKNAETDFTAKTVKYADLTNAFFKDTSRSSENEFSLKNYAMPGHAEYSNPNVKIYDLTADWKLKNGLVLSAGTLILGLNDNKLCTGDSDFDDMIVAVSRTAPTPLPGAVWLLGSGLLGIMGFKRARKTTENA